MSLLNLGADSGQSGGGGTASEGDAAAAAAAAAAAGAGGGGGAGAGSAGGGAADAGNDAGGAAGAAVSRPEHVPEKFWIADKNEVNVAELAKSYTALEQIQGRGKQAWEQEFFAARPASPEAYELKEVNGVKPDDLKAHPMFAPLTKFAHARGASSEQLQEVINEIAANVAAATPDPEAELKKLGENAEARITTLTGFYRPIAASKPSVAPVLESIASSAAGIELLEVLMAQAKGVSLEKVIDVPIEEGDSQADIEKLMAQEGYWRGTDKALIERVQKYFARKSAKKAA